MVCSGTIEKRECSLSHCLSKSAHEDGEILRGDQEYECMLKLPHRIVGNESLMCDSKR